MRIRNNSSSILMLTTAIGCALAVPTTAFAQDKETDQGGSRYEGRDVIIVTATKREQTLQDVPVAVSVVPEEEISKAEIQDLIDLQSVVPSLRVTQIQVSNATNFIIRGFGNGANNPGIEPSVGVFIDGVYRSRSGASISDLPNLKRVEVLRGPQSTLFGKNASAGVVSLVTESPQFELGGSAEVTYGNYDTVRLTGDITGPLSETLAASLYGSYNRRNGFARDLFTGADVNDRDRFAFRGQLLFEPNADLTARLIADYDQFNELCCAAANLVNGPTGAAIFALGGAINPEDPYSRRVFNNTNSRNKNRNYGVSLQLDYDFGAFTATSITAYRRTENDNVQDVDFTSLDILFPNANSTRIGTFTQELRLSSTGDGPLSWTVGGFFFDESIDIDDEVGWATQTRAYVDALLGGTGLSLGLLETVLGATPGSYFGNGQGAFVDAGQDNISYSFFANVDYELFDGLTLTLGGNYTNDRKDAFERVLSTDVFAQTDLSVLTPVIGPAGVGALQQIQIFPEFLNFPNAVESGRSNDNDFSYTIRLAYDVNPELNAYVSYATGFKATSWNLSRDNRPFAADLPAINAAGLGLTNLASGTRFAGPEQAKVWELGLKGAFKNLSFNLALFDQTIDDFQTFVFLGTGFGLANAGRESTRGFELEGQLRPLDGLSLNAAVTYLDPQYDSFPSSQFGDLSGETPAQIPDWAFSLGFNYDFAVGNAKAFVRADYQFESASAFEDDPALDAAVSALFSNEVHLVNASAGVRFETGTSVQIFARNLFDYNYIVFAFPSVFQGGSYSGFANDPMTWGFTVRQEF